MAYLPIYDGGGFGIPRYVCRLCNTSISEAEHAQGDGLCARCWQGLGRESSGPYTIQGTQGRAS